MVAQRLYGQLAKDFIKEGITDLEWAAKMPNLDQYLYNGFRQSGMGLMCDFTDKIEQVYTTTFLSDKVLAEILSDDSTHAMIFSHHPTNWDLEHHNGTYAATEKYIAELKDRNISIYVLHHPLDNYGVYSTCKTLADSVHMKIERPAFLYSGALCGVVGTVDCQNIHELHERYSKAMGHRTSLYPYGSESIQGERIAICPGGGNDPHIVEEMLGEGIRTLLTGITIVNEHSKETHQKEKENRVNVLGGTHYSTERFAPMKMCEYFNQLGIDAKFVDDVPNLYDL